MEEIIHTIVSFAEKNLYALSFAAILLAVILLRFILRRIVLARTKKFSSLVMFVIDWTIVLSCFYTASHYISKLQFMNATLFKLGSTAVNLFGILSALFLVILANRLAKALEMYLMPTVYQKYSMDKGAGYTLTRLIHYAIMTVAVLSALSLLGLNLSNLSMFGSLLGVGLGFGLQNIASNFVSGIILLFERPIKVGDRVVVNDILGDIVDIKMRATVIRTMQNEHIIIPNSDFLSKNIVSHSFGDLKLRLDLPIGVSYDSDMETVKKALLEAVELTKPSMPSILSSPAPEVSFYAISACSFDLKLFVWISDPLREVPVTSTLYFNIVEKVREYNIEMPYPQTDIRFRSELTGSCRTST